MPFLPYHEEAFSFIYQTHTINLGGGGGWVKVIDHTALMILVICSILLSLKFNMTLHTLMKGMQSGKTEKPLSD